MRVVPLGLAAVASLACGGLFDPPDSPAPGASKSAAATGGEAGPCVGTWTGVVNDGGGFSGTITATITEPTAPSIDDPAGGRCGTIAEDWGPDGECQLKLKECSYGPLIAVGEPQWLSSCTGRISLELRCEGSKATYRRKEQHYRVSGELTRE